PAADRHHRVDRLEARLQRLFHRLPIHDAWRKALDGHDLLRHDRPLAVDRLAERVDDAADQLLADRHRDDAAGAFDRIPLANLGEVAEQHRTDAFFFQVERNAKDAVRELEHLAGHRVFDAVDTGDAVADRHDGPDFGDVDVHGIAADLVADDFRDFFGFDVHMWLAARPT